MRWRNFLMRGIASVLVLLSGAVRAELIDQGRTTLDTETGLEWLDVSETVGVSPRDIIVDGYGGLAAEGWVHGTLDEIASLFEHAGIPLPFNGSLTPAGFEGANRLIAWMGFTGTQGDSVFIQAFSGTASAPGGPPFLLYTPVVITSSGIRGGADLEGAIVPSSVNNPTLGNYLVRLAEVGPLQVVIDVKPGSQTNPVNPRGDGLIPVAILTTEQFDAPARIDPVTVRFGPGEAQPAHGRAHYDDVDGDWNLDVLFHFRVAASGIRCGDTEVALTGLTRDGESFEGWDAVATVACRPQGVFAPRDVRPPGR